MNQEDEATKLAHEIGRYLANHPHAADSLEGVVKWWISKDRYEPASEKVKEALDQLIAGGVAKAELSVDGKLIYSNVSRPDFVNDR